MKKISIAIFLIFSLLSFGQSSNDKVIYLDSLGNDSDSDHYYSKQIVKDYYLEKKDYLVEKYIRAKNKNIPIKTVEIPKNPKIYFDDN